MLPIIKNFVVFEVFHHVADRQTDRQTDILLTERKSLQTYLSYKRERYMYR